MEMSIRNAAFRLPAGTIVGVISGVIVTVGEPTVPETVGVGVCVYDVAVGETEPGVFRFEWIIYYDPVG
jgi:hypothetical protein